MALVKNTGQPAPALQLFTSLRATPPDGSELGSLLKAYRAEKRLSQTKLAELLHWDQSYVSLVEQGNRQIRDVEELRRIAALLDLPEDELGLLPVIDAVAASAVVGSGAEPREVVAEQRAWRSARRSLNRHRAELSIAAARLYPDVERVGQTPLLAPKDWMFTQPVNLDEVILFWRSDARQPVVTGAEAASEPVRPMSMRGRLPRYSTALRLVDRPVLFVNRPSYRLLEIASDSEGTRLEFGYTSYFDMVDVCEAIAHELAAAWGRAEHSETWLNAPSWDQLNLRSLIGDPFDLARRALLPSIDTLTIRRAEDGKASFTMHRRAAANVALAGALLHVMPAGVFQPSSTMPWDQANDFDLWRNMMREYAEEFLGDPEADGESGEPIDYSGSEPYRSLERARVDGSIRPWCLGVGLDPLTLAGEILTVVVADADVYDEIFADMVERNAEGAVAGSDAQRPQDGIAFTEENVVRLLADEPLAPAAAALLHLAWEHRDRLLA